MFGTRYLRGTEALTTTVRLQLLWLATGLLALAVPGRPLALTLVIATVAVLIVLTAPGLTTATRLALALSFLPAAFAGQAPTSAWLAAAVLMSIATSVPRPAESGEAPLLRHLERARRRGEPATVMVFGVPSLGRRVTNDLQRRLRAADSVRTVRRVGSGEIHAVMDGGDVEVDVIESRLQAHEIAGAAVGWARFPGDGGSLDVLLATARERACESDADAAHAATTDRPAASFTPSMVKAD